MSTQVTHAPKTGSSETRAPEAWDRPFVPKPLPPSFPYNRDLAHFLSEANRCLGELAGLARQLPNPHLLIRPFMRQEAVSSSRIEGTEAELVDLYAFEAGQRTLPGFRVDADRKDVREVRNYVLAMEHGLKRLDDLPVSLRLIREVHEILMRGVRGRRRSPGEFRRVQNWIGPPGCRMEDANFIPTPVNQLDQTLGDLEKYINFPREGGDPSLIRLALIHYQFEAIHPFLDGNGRIGRLMITLLLVHWNLLPLPLLYLSSFFERRRQKYYELLLGVSREGNWIDWILFFLEGVATQAREANLLAKRLQDLRQDWHKELAQPGSSILVHSLVDSLFEKPFVTIPEAQRVLGVSYPTAKKHVERLESLGILKLVPRSYPKAFFAQTILEIIIPST